MTRLRFAVLATILLSLFAVQLAEAQNPVTWTDIAAGLAKSGTEVTYEPIPVGISTICYAKVNSAKDIEELSGFSKKQLLDADVGFAGEIDGFWVFNLGPGPCPPPGASAGENEKAYQLELALVQADDPNSYPFPTWLLTLGLGLVMIFVLWCVRIRRFADQVE